MFVIENSVWLVIVCTRVWISFDMQELCVLTQFFTKIIAKGYYEKAYFKFLDC